MLQNLLYVLLIAVISTFNVKSDVMQHYLDSSSTYFFNEKNLDLQGERFTLEQPIILNSVTFKVLGAKGETGEVILFGNEGGNPLPIYESKLVDGIKFEKSYNGIEWITIDLDVIISDSSSFTHTNI